MPRRSVVVLGGGFSPERNVSLAGAANIAAKLRRAGHAAVVVDPCGGELTPEQEADRLAGPIPDAPSAAELAALRRRTDVLALLRTEPLRRAEVAFPILHGAFGEDGRLQALLEAAGLAYVGSDYFAQALAMNKHVAKQLFERNRIPTPAWRRLVPGGTLPPGMKFPCVVKPANAGSSLGVSTCAGETELVNALARAFEYDREALVEDWIPGREFTVGVFGDRVLAIGEIRAQGDFDYHAKYRAAATREIFPADLPAAIAERAVTLASAVVETLRLRHYCRIDFIVNPAQEIFILEANAAPGMTQKSLYPRSAEAAGLGFAAVCAELCEMAIREPRP